MEVKPEQGSGHTGFLRHGLGHDRLNYLLCSRAREVVELREKVSASYPPTVTGRSKDKDGEDEENARIVAGHFYRSTIEDR